MLIRAFTFKIDNATAVSMLNTVYAIFLGLLFTFFLSLETPDTNKPSNISNKNGIAPAAINKNVANLEPSSPTGITLKLYINSKNCLPVILMSLYFLFDWFSCNLTMIIKNKDIHHWLVIVLIVIITYLGVIVVLSFVSNLIFYIGFALYALIVPWWDIRLKDMELQGGIFLLMIFIGRLIVAFLLLSFIVMNFFKPDGICERLYSLAMICLCVYVVLKIVRYFLLAQFSEQISN